MNRFVTFYKSSAVIVLNTLFFVVLFNVILMGYFNYRDQAPSTDNSPVELSPEGFFYENGTSVDNGQRMPSDLINFDYTGYEDAMSEQEIGALLDEFYLYNQNGMKYQAYSQYGPRVYNGEQLNIDREPNGLTVRRTTNPSSPGTSNRTIRIFTFGGSTTFGTGLADRHIWTSQLSEILNAREQAGGSARHVEITNYGRPAFYPTQELQLYMEVLRSGERPDIVIFLDGLNLGGADDTSTATPLLAAAVDAAQGIGFHRWDWLPMMRAARAIQRRVQDTHPQQPEPVRSAVRVQHLAAMFTQARINAQAISDIYGVQAVFVLQPDALYNYPAHLYENPAVSYDRDQRVLRESLYEIIRAEDAYFDLTQLFEQWGDRKALIDPVHYSPHFSRFLAERIARHIDLRVVEETDRPPAIATGVTRTH